MALVKEKFDKEKATDEKSKVNKASSESEMHKLFFMDKDEHHKLIYGNEEEGSELNELSTENLPEEEKEPETSLQAIRKSVGIIMVIQIIFLIVLIILLFSILKGANRVGWL
jgi:hypothetical protein